MGPEINFDEIETDIGKCFPIYAVVSVCLNESFLTQKDSKPNIAKLLNSFCSFVYGMLNASNFSKSVYLSS